MNIPLVDLRAQYATIKPEVDAAIQRVLDNTSFILGDEVKTFEASFAAHIGSSGAVGVASGTAAIQLALQACGVGPGDEVITSAHTFIATAEPIVTLGATPVFVDIDPATFNLDPDLVEEAITPRTKVILPVHLYGRPAPMGDLMAIAQRRGLVVIEDAAQAHGACWHAQAVGTIGAMACFSFYPGKNLGAYGDAGAVTSNDPDLLARVRKLRDHGRTSKYEHDEVGYGERIDALQAAILGAKLPHLTAWTDARRRHARRYTELLTRADVTPPAEDPQDEHVFHLYVIRSGRRDALLAALQKAGVGAGIHYPIPLHRQPAFRDLSPVSLPHTETAATEILSLPLYPELRAEQIDYVADQVRQFA